MHLVYNAIKTRSNQKKKNSESQKKYDAYVAVCNKYKHDIVAIQKYIPDWQPLFGY